MVGTHVRNHRSFSWGHSLPHRQSNGLISIGAILGYSQWLGLRNHECRFECFQENNRTATRGNGSNENNNSSLSSCYVRDNDGRSGSIMGTAIAVASSFLSNGNWETSDGVTSNKTKVLAYLGQLRSNEFVRGRKLVFDLSLRYRTAQKTLELLVVRGLVDKKIETRNGTIALYRINPSIAVILPEWSANYGRHPYGT